MQTGTAMQPEVEMTLAEQASAYDHRMRELEQQILSTWHEAGSIALAMRNCNGWEILGFSSFNSWLMDAAPKSRSVCYAAMSALEELEDVPAEDLKQIAHSTVHVLKKLPKDVRADPQVRESAKKLTTKEFTRKMKADHPELHLENLITREFRLTASQEEVIDKALAKAKKIYDLDDSDEFALESVCADFLLTENGD